MRIREKIGKLSFYNNQAAKMWGEAIANEMYQTDLDFLISLLVLIGESREEGH